MRFTLVLKALAAVGRVALLPFSAIATDRVSYAYQLDPTFDAAVWETKTGQVELGKIEVEPPTRIVFSDLAEMPANITDGDIKAIDMQWEPAARRSLLQSKSDVLAFIAPDAVRG